MVEEVQVHWLLKIIDFDNCNLYLKGCNEKHPFFIHFVYQFSKYYAKDSMI